MFYANVFDGGLPGLGATQADADAVVASNEQRKAAYLRALDTYQRCLATLKGCQVAAQQKAEREAAYQQAYDAYTAAVRAHSTKMLERAKRIAKRAQELALSTRGTGIPATGPTGDVRWALPLAIYSISDAARARALENCKRTYPALRGLGSIDTEIQSMRNQGLTDCQIAILPSAPAPAPPLPPRSPTFSDLQLCERPPSCGSPPPAPSYAEVPSVDETTFVTTDAGPLDDPGDLPMTTDPVEPPDDPIVTIDPAPEREGSSSGTTGLLLVLAAVAVAGGAYWYMKKGAK